MIGSYSPGLVILSIIVATLASYTALALAQRIKARSVARQRHVWLVGGSLAMGIGIWSMHFLGMLAFTLPIPVGYDPWITLASLGIAVVVSWFALDSVTHGPLSVKRLLIGGTLMGLGICAMHYTGMMAMLIRPEIYYTPWIVAASVAIAVAAALTSLWIALALRAHAHHELLLRQVGAAMLMGGAIAGMHYTAMAAANFSAHSTSLAAHVDNTWLAITIAGLSFGVLATALMLSFLDARMEAQTSRLAASLQEANDQLMHLATHDALTNLPNRLLLRDRIQHAIHASRRSGKPFAVIYIDLDGFKTVNDSLGHPLGDGLLKAVAKRIREVLHGEDTLARVGGDEFVALVEGLNQADEAVNVCERIVSAMHASLDVDETQLNVTTSIGIAIFPNDGDTGEVLLQNADAAMYDVKRTGRNGYRYFEPAMNSNALRVLCIQTDLRKGLENGELFLHFQPKFTALDQQLIGAEALIRWRHPELGLVGPSEFIPIAERSGLILDIGDWVIHEACRHLVKWRAEGMQPVKIAINLPPKQLMQRDLAAKIAAIVRSYGLDPKVMMLEITETAAMEDAEANVVTIHELQRQGFDVAIDDFGTGYSSLSYLQQFRVRQLKVDRFFVEGLDKSGEEGPAIVSAIIALAHALQMEVVAEGVETDAQLQVLRGLACDQFQGYLLGRPMSATDFMRLLNRALPNPEVPAEFLQADPLT